MFSEVSTKDMAIETSHEVLHITIRIQMSGNIDLEGNYKGRQYGRGEPLPLPPPINKNKKGYVKRAKNSTKPSNNKDHTSKSKRTQCK